MANTIAPNQVRIPPYPIDKNDGKQGLPPVPTAVPNTSVPTGAVPGGNPDTLLNTTPVVPSSGSIPNPVDEQLKSLDQQIADEQNKNPGVSTSNLVSLALQRLQLQMQRNGTPMKSPLPTLPSPVNTAGNYINSNVPPVQQTSGNVTPPEGATPATPGGPVIVNGQNPNVPQDTNKVIPSPGTTPNTNNNLTSQEVSELSDLTARIQVLTPAERQRFTDLQIKATGQQGFSGSIGVNMPYTNLGNALTTNRGFTPATPTTGNTTTATTTGRVPPRELTAQEAQELKGLQAKRSAGSNDQSLMFGNKNLPEKSSMTSAELSRLTQLESIHPPEFFSYTPVLSADDANYVLATSLKTQPYNFVEPKVVNKPILNKAGEITGYNPTVVGGWYDSTGNQVTDPKQLAEAEDIRKYNESLQHNKDDAKEFLAGKLPGPETKYTLGNFLDSVNGLVDTNNQRIYSLDQQLQSKQVTVDEAIKTGDFISAIESNKESKQLQRDRLDMEKTQYKLDILSKAAANPAMLFFMEKMGLGQELGVNLSQVMGQLTQGIPPEYFTNLPNSQQLTELEQRIPGAKAIVLGAHAALSGMTPQQQEEILASNTPGRGGRYPRYSIVSKE